MSMRVLGVSWWLTPPPTRRPSEVALDALHQLPDVVGEVDIAPIFRRHDEPELVPLAEARLLEGLAGRGALAAVKHARRPVLLDAVALDVPKVSGGRVGAVPSELLHVRVDERPRRALVPEDSKPAVGGSLAGLAPRRPCPRRTSVATRRESRRRVRAPDRSGRSEAGKSARACRRNGGGCPSEDLPRALVGAARPAAARPGSRCDAKTSKEPEISSCIHRIIQIRGFPFILPSRHNSGSQRPTSVMPNECHSGCTAAGDHPAQHLVIGPVLASLRSLESVPDRGRGGEMLQLFHSAPWHIQLRSRVRNRGRCGHLKRRGWRRVDREGVPGGAPGGDSKVPRCRSFDAGRRPVVNARSTRSRDGRRTSPTSVSA